MSGTTQVVGSVAENVAVSRRNIAMKDFRSAAVVRRAVTEQITVAAGQVIGTVHAIVEKEGTLPDGTVRKNLQAVGRFEGVNYGSGEVITAASAYLPKYYLESLAAMLESARKNTSGVAAAMLAVEIACEPTGLDEQTGLPKNPSYAWVVKDLMPAQADDPLAAIKRKLAAAGHLRLAAPKDDSGALTHDGGADDGGADDGGADDGAEAGAEAATETPAASKRKR